jgi:polyphenol oxidase
MTIYLTHQDFDQVGISYGFFGRKGGVSQGVYSSLNVGLGSNDDRDAVIKNREIIRETLRLSNLSTLYQIHSNVCHVIDKPLDKVVEADALVTATAGVGIGILTADCGPILFHGQSKKGHVIGAAHAGWGGAVKGILESTIDNMIAQGAVLSSIKVMIGPCIHQPSYEVSPEFLKPFLDEDQASQKFFALKGEKFLFDLPAYIEFRLRRKGVQTVIQSGCDTYAMADDYFSFRRKTHQNEPDYGRQISVISIDLNQ